MQKQYTLSQPSLCNGLEKVVKKVVFAVFGVRGVCLLGVMYM
jgi:hypothetical protein